MIVKQLAGVTSALQTAETPAPPQRSRAARLADAARELEDANKKYNTAFETMQAAEERAAKARAILAERADA
eukprot:7603834-Pyramimonas_sp.AAC.1